MTQSTLPVRRPEGTPEDPVRRGRPEYSDVIRKKIITALKTGMTRAAAAGSAGVARSTLYDWISKDADFAEEVGIAEDFAEARYSATISELRGPASPPAVRLRAAEFWLDRRRPNEWRERSSVEITLPPEVDEARSRQVDDLRDELRALGEELLRRGTDRARREG